MSRLTNYLKTASRVAVITWTLILINGCSSTKPDIQYVQKIVEVPVQAPPQLIQPCAISERKGNKVRDYIVSERRLRNDLIVCNIIMEARNKHERQRGEVGGGM